MVSLKKQLRRAPGITTVVHGSTAVFPFDQYSEAAARLKVDPPKQN